MIITKLSYQLSSTSQLFEIEIVKRGTFSDQSSTSAPGSLISSEINVYSPGITTEKDKTMILLLRSGAIFHAKDNSGNTHIVGNDDMKAQFSFQKKNDGKPGAVYGYQIKITWKSISGAKLTVL